LSNKWRDSLKGFFTRNLSLKLISIFLAGILWYFVISEKEGETALSIPLDFRNIPSSLIIIKNPVESINIRISGPVTLLRGLSHREVKALIDLSDAKPGVSTFGIQPQDITVPRGLRVSMRSPDSIMLRFDELFKKTVLVEAVLVGKPLEGYKIAGVWVDPTAVEIVGAQNELRKLRKIFTEEIDISGLKKDSTRKAALSLGELHIKSISREEVKVNLKCTKVPSQ
jgi:YbbR domain-containing protein